MRGDKFLVLMLIVFLISLIKVNAWNCGTFMTTNYAGLDKSEYNIGESVYISGHGFDTKHSNPATGCTWKVKRDAFIIATGNITTDVNGNIAPTSIYSTVLDDLGKEMKVYLKCTDCNKLVDRFTVQINQVPEFNGITILIAILGALISLIVIRKKN